MKTHNFYIFFLTFSVLGCSSNGTQDRRVNRDSAAKNSVSNIKYEDTIIDSNMLTAFRKQKSIIATTISQKKDTLVILAYGNDINYPLGEFDNLKRLMANNPLFGIKTEYSKDSVDAIKLYRFSYENSFVKFIYQPLTKKFEIVSAEINDSKIILLSGVSIGMTKSAFLDLFFRQNVDQKMQHVDVVKFVSVVEGMWQYYTFKNGKLNKIRFDTDYQVDKS